MPIQQEWKNGVSALRKVAESFLPLLSKLNALKSGSVMAPLTSSEQRWLDDIPADALQAFEASFVQTLEQAQAIERGQPMGLGGDMLAERKPQPTQSMESVLRPRPQKHAFQAIADRVPANNNADILRELRSRVSSPGAIALVESAIRDPKPSKKKSVSLVECQSRRHEHSRPAMSTDEMMLSLGCSIPAEGIKR